MIYDTQIFKKILDTEYLKNLNRRIQEHIPFLTDSEITVASHGIYYYVGDEIQNELLTKLPLLENEIASVYLLKHTGCTSPHTDTNLSDEDTESDPYKFARTFIVPLETQDTHTIVFDQHLDKGVVGNKMIEYVLNLPTINKIPEDTLRKYFDSFRQEYWVDKLSVDTIFEWVAGDVLVFDRNKIHTGDDHLNKIEKYGIVIWTVK